MRTTLFLVAVLLVGGLATVLPTASASCCAQDPRDVVVCGVDVLGYAGVGVTVDVRYSPVDAYGYYCIDTHSHPGIQDCQYWVLD